MEETKRSLIKVVHVHFLHGRRNYYFGSVKAVFRKFSDKDIGCTYDYLSHHLCHDGDKYLNDKVLIIRARLER